MLDVLVVVLVDVVVLLELVDEDVVVLEDDVLDDVVVLEDDVLDDVVVLEDDVLVDVVVLLELVDEDVVVGSPALAGKAAQKQVIRIIDTAHPEPNVGPIFPRPRHSIMCTPRL